MSFRCWAAARDDVATAATNLVNRLNDIPFEAIGKNLNQTLAGVNALVNDKELGQSVAALRSTCRALRAWWTTSIMACAPAMQRLPAIASGLEDSVKRTDKLIGVAGQRLWRRFALQPRRRQVDGATVRCRPLDPGVGRPAVAPPGGADPRPHRPRGFNECRLAAAIPARRAVGAGGAAGRLLVAQPDTLRAGADARARPMPARRRSSQLRAIAIAHYLERSQIVRSSEGYRMDVLSNEWWGEPLDTMMGRILVQELNQRLPGSTVYGDSGAISTPADATVEINLQRFDLDRDGAVLLAAQVAVDGRESASGACRSRSGRRMRPPRRWSRR